MNGILENGYFKLIALCFAIGAYLWQGGAYQASVKGQFDMVSYQINELDKRMATAITDTQARLARVEGSIEPTSAWRLSVQDGIQANRKLIDDTRDQLNHKR